MKKSMRLFCLFISIAVILVCFSTIFSAREIRESSAELNSMDEGKIYSEATLEDNFSDSRVLVIFKKKLVRN